MDLKINETFRNVSKKVLDIQVREVDFWDGKNASETINNWVESTTRGKINELFTPGTISSQFDMQNVCKNFISNENSNFRVIY